MTDTTYTGRKAPTARDPHELIEIFASAEDLPTLPEVAVRLQKAVDNPRSGAREIARIIEDDPAIATRVLKVVNSVFYAPRLGSPITGLQPAIARLGFMAVSNIALSTSVFAACAKAQNPLFDRREFWRHSVCVGIVASVLHDYCIEVIEQPISRDAVHLAGIVHDLGKILFERYANQEFHAAIRSARQADIPLVKEECRLVGMGHDEAGAWLCQRWNIDVAIRAVVRWHHDPRACPEKQLQGLINLVHMADYICHTQALGNSANSSPCYDPVVREELKLTGVTIGQIMNMVEEEAAHSEILLSLAD